MRFLRKYIFSNALLKVLALGISFMLWVTYTSEPPAEVGFPVPLEFSNMSGQMEISGDVPTVIRVRVRGRSSLLRRMVPSDLRLSLDMTDRKEGDTVIKLSPDMVVAPYGATIVGLSPDEFHVILVPRSRPLVSAQ